MVISWKTTSMKRILSVTILFGIALNYVEATDRPIIGVLAQEVYGTNESYIAASYVKMIESSGARVVPIFIGRSYEYYEEMCGYLNGVVVPGGSADVYGNGYGQAARYIYDIALALNADKHHFPVLGVCLGLEALAVISSEMATNVLSNVSGTSNIALKLTFKPGYLKSSLYEAVPHNVIHTLKTEPVTSNHHSKALLTSSLKTMTINSIWRVLTTSKDKNNVTFVSSMQHFDFPIAALQFHPEKVLYEWKSSQHNPHSYSAIVANRIFYDWLVRESRKSDHSFPSLAEESAALIYNYEPIYTGLNGGSFEQEYRFGPNDEGISPQMLLCEEYCHDHDNNLLQLTESILH